ncbi:MAG TPA: EAL domain-containing protein [Usitatibacter sp.]|nr:EAL domain-containing protein [Usitatibacter sp.]
MRPARILAAAGPYAGAAASGVLIALMIATVSLTSFERQWIVFLSGVLAAAVFSLLSHIASARWTLARRSAQLNAMRARLAEESGKRREAEASLAGLRASLQLAYCTREAEMAADIVPADDFAATLIKAAELPVVDALAARLIEALEHNEFSLYSQSIVPLGAAGDGASFCEVLLRMKEEEEKLIPPGTFLPVAEEHGLLPDIDRWVIRNVLKSAAVVAGGSDAVYFVNLAPPTVTEGGLAAFVRRELDGWALDGSILCFEFPEADVIAKPRAYRDLIAALDGSGCRFSVSGFGRNAASVQFLRQLRVSYVKLDGDVALNLTRGADERARAQALIVAAHAAGMQVVAQCVENDATLKLLRVIEADFAQGFGIAMPRLMTSPPIGATPPARAGAELQEVA